MITLYQESVPFSNKWYNGKISQNNTYTNPVIVPYALNTTLSENVLETVVYIKNDDQSKYYKNIVISLMTEDAGTPSTVSGRLDFSKVMGKDVIKLSLNSYQNKPVGLAFEYAGGTPTGSITLPSAYKSTYKPVVDTPGIDVRFSYGYDELSPTKWKEQPQIMLIPTLGTSGEFNTAYNPVRMRITLTNGNTMFTNRNYFIDISYAEELTVGA